MSRSTAENDRYEMAFGVDHVLGAFFQIWEKSHEDQIYGNAQIAANECFGFTDVDSKTVERNTKLRTVIDHYKSNARWLRNEETIINIGKSIDLEITKEVYKLWD